MGNAPSHAESSSLFIDAKNTRANPTQIKNIKDKYDLTKELGRGAFSVVFVAKQKGDASSESVAIKRVSKKQCNSKDDVEGLLEEVGILQEIHHPHVMRLHAFYEDPDYYSLVTELVSGGELFDRIVERNHYNEEIARDLVKIFISTLDFLHSNGIVHRDLKPENLLLASKDDDTNIKIADFGFAKHISAKLNSICGTPDYLAPEICRLLDLKDTPKDKRPCYDTKCDIWSAGVIVYILLGGYPPFFDDNRKRLFKKIKAGKFEFHKQYWSDVSEDAKDFISLMLTVDYTKRPSAKQLLQHPWLKQLGIVLSGNDLSTAKAELKRFNSRRKFKAAVDAVLAAQRLTLNKLEPAIVE